jgi:hypothetical protein
MGKVCLGLVLGLLAGVLLAQRGAATYPDAVTADPKHYSVSFENELVRFLRVRYGPARGR